MPEKLDELIETYEEFVRSTRKYKNVGNNLDYPSLGLCGEAGEVAEKVKRLHREGSKGKHDPEFVRAMNKELGDNLWYLVAIAQELGISLAAIMFGNMTKIKDRDERGKLYGEGDER